MRSLLALLAVAVLLLASGCTEAPPSQQAATPAASPATTAPPVTPPAVPPTSPPAALPTTHALPTGTGSVSDNTITIVKNTFRPANITVKTGSTVRWVNADDHPHNIAFADKDFSASTYLLGASQSFSQRFDRPGTFDFVCLIHPQMKGAVTVEA